MLYTLFKLLEEYKVVIPVIQRDYAQGRKGKEFLRKSFLTQIKKSLEAPNNKTTLDFIYGSLEKDSFLPLDGQQRLTTLWLVYWYVALKSKKLNDDNIRKILEKFSYQTRASSCEFCKAICNEIDLKKYEDYRNSKSDKTIADEDYRNSKSDKTIADFIKSQTWFFSSWNQDPTINSMLRTIGGDNDNLEDNIEVLFKDADFEDFSEKLYSENAPIDFELMIINSKDLPMSDDLYIKMNARGKALTNFENFKADLIGYIHSSDAFNGAAPNAPELTYKEYLPSQIDSCWTDVFWSVARKRAEKENIKFNGNIDNIFFAFINRYVLNEICLNEQMGPDEFAASSEKESNKSQKSDFEKLFGISDKSKTDDRLIVYDDFGVYSKYLSEEKINVLDHVFLILDDQKNKVHDQKNKVLDLINSALNFNNVDDQESGYNFIPKEFVSTNLKERVYFLAITLYIERTESAEAFNEVNFKKWMRIIKNLIENAVVESLPVMVTCMRLIKDLCVDPNVKDIYETLNNFNNNFSNSQLGLQLLEEKQKAQKILEEKKKGNSDWEEKIIDAENYSFFNGTIRFLYRDENKEICWENFDAKFENAKWLFSDEQKGIVKTETIKALLRYFDGFDEIRGQYLFTSIGYDHRNKCWKKNILCSDNACVQRKVQKLLMSDKYQENYSEDYEHFINSTLIEHIVEQKENYRYRYTERNGLGGIYKDYTQTQGVLLSSNRRTKCKKLNDLVTEKKISIANQNLNIFVDDYCWGLYVDFDIKEKTYRWLETSVNGKEVDKIVELYQTKEYSKNTLQWDDSIKDSSDLISKISQFSFT